MLETAVIALSSLLALACVGWTVAVREAAAQRGANKARARRERALRDRLALCAWAVRALAEEVSWRDRMLRARGRTLRALADLLAGR